jgi:transposase-like protein
MPLTNALNYTLVGYTCSHCGHRFERTGLWFKSVSHFRCEACGRQLQLSYGEKVTLFEQHDGAGEPGPSEK